MRFRSATVPAIRATSALEQLHAELAGKLQTNKRETQRLKRGTVLRHIMDVLRTAEQPLTPREITDRMLAARGIVNPDPDEAYKLSKSVASAMLGHKGNGLAAHRQTVPIRWSLADRD